MKTNKIAKKLDKNINLNGYCTAFALIYKNGHVDIYWIHDITEDKIEHNQSFETIVDFETWLPEEPEDVRIIEHINLSKIDEDLIEIKEWYF